MGLNGSGKSTICKVLMGDPNYKIESGSIFFKDIDLLISSIPIKYNITIPKIEVNYFLNDRNKKQIEYI